MTICNYCGWQGSGDHDASGFAECRDILLDKLHAAVEERNFLEVAGEKAALRIADLEADRDRLVAALRPFAAYYAKTTTRHITVPVDDCRRAVEALIVALPTSATGASGWRY